jgi:hypothetical protein
MSEHHTTLTGVTRGQPCAICGKSDKCSRGADGSLWCGRTFADVSGFKCLGKSRCETWGIFRTEEEIAASRRDSAHTNGNDNGKRTTPDLPAIDWTARAQTFANALTIELRDELAADLGLPPAAVSDFAYIGWSDREWNNKSEKHEPAFILPEFAGDKVVGLNCRFRDGHKKMMAGSLRGLTIAEHWDKGGDVHLVEGFSDSAALGAMGLTALGRPNNLAGAEQLAEMLREVPSSRRMIVHGEYDPKPNGDWPGFKGATLTAAKLAKALDRHVYWTMPPDGAKDARKWALQQIASGKSWDAIGAAFVAGLKVQGAKPEEKASGWTFEPITSAEFDAAEYRLEWLVKRALVRGQFGVIGGASKSMKTSLAVDLALSLGTGLRSLAISTFTSPCESRSSAGRVASTSCVKPLGASRRPRVFGLPKLMSFGAFVCRSSRALRTSSHLGKGSASTRSTSWSLIRCICRCSPVRRI